MDANIKRKIKSELKREAERMINSQSLKFRSNMNAIQKLEMWGKKFSNVEGFTNKLTEKLNKILEREKVEFTDEKEKNEFIKFIKPTIQELIVKNIKK